MDYTPIVLLTDFGQQDGYVGIMKGIIAKIAPTVPVIDLSHHIPPQNVTAASFVLWNAYRYFPIGTCFVCVVDPGVGTNRDIIIVDTGEYRFLAPDNGLLDWALFESTDFRTWKLTNSYLMLPQVSTTFHGRDIFAPAAAHMKAGFPVDETGELRSYTRHLAPMIDPSGQTVVHGQIIYIDHFGNLITNIRLKEDHHGIAYFREKSVQLKGTYGDVASGRWVAMRASHGMLELAIRKGNAAQISNAKYGESISFELKSKP